MQRLLTPTVFTLAVLQTWMFVEAAGPLDVVVSIVPQREIVERIAGDAVSVRVLVKPGESPATTTLAPRELAELAAADVLFTIGVPFDRVLASRLSDIAPDLLVVDSAREVERQPIDASHSESSRQSAHHHDHSHAAGELDPHVWLDPHRVKTIASTVHGVLVELAPEHRARFTEALAAYHHDLDGVDERIRRRLAPFRGRPVCVFHPAYGYFTRRYGLRQIPIEVDGKSPTPRQLADVLSIAGEAGIRAVFVQPQFSTRSAEAVASSIGARVVPLDPLAPDHLANLDRMSLAIADALSDTRAE